MFTLTIQTCKPTTLHHVPTATLTCYPLSCTCCDSLNNGRDQAMMTAGLLQAHAANYSREEWEDEDIFVNHEEAQFLLVSGDGLQG
jgi:hypothetical protein